MTTTISETDHAARPLEPQMRAFEALEKASGQATPPWLRCLRTSGIAYLGELGLPTSALEDWRQTNPAPLSTFEFRTPELTATLSREEVDRLLLPGLKGPRLVFVDGFHAPALSDPLTLPEGCFAGSLATGIHSMPELLEKHLGRAARHETNALAAMNTAFLRDGALVRVTAGQEVKAPIYILHIAATAGAVIQPRSLFLVEAGASVEIIEDFVSLGSAQSWTNGVTEIFAGENATVEHVKIQRENGTSLHTATIEGRQKADSRIRSHSISLGARLARNDINLRFEDTGCESILNGLYFAEGDQLVDHHTIADHRSPHCASHEFYHGIMAGRAKGVFNGRIFVRQDAQKTDAKQTNRNLLLSTDATVHTKPQLEIFADDVKCTHGATVGQLDEEALFYLRARGIGESSARRMLIQAFASDVLNRIHHEPIRTALESLLAGRLDRQLVLS
jgi:Fe-S cluster assembly protein SufD